MRIGTNTIFDQGLAAIQRQQRDLLRTQQQVASGRRVLTPADDPLAATQALQVEGADSANTQYRINRDYAIGRLDLAETTVSSVVDLIQNVRELAVQAGDGALSNSDRAAIAIDLEQRFQQLLAIANTTDGNGDRLFSGYQSALQSFSTGASGVQYLGDDGERLAQVTATRQIGTSFAGSDVFQRIRNGNGIFIAQPLSVNAGSGIISPGAVLDRAAWDASNRDFTIKFSQVATLTAGTLNTGGSAAAGGIVNQAQWDAGSRDYTVVFTAPNAYEVRDTATAAVIASGAYTSGATISFQGAEVVITDAPGAPAAGDAFRIVAAVPAALTYDIIDNVTGQSALTGAAAGAPPYARTYTSGAAIVLAAQGAEPAFNFGVEVSIEGPPAAGDRFTLKGSANQDLFRTISDLATLLRAGGGGAVANARIANGLNVALSNLDQALDHMLKVRSEVGARLREIDSLNVTGEDLGVQYQATLSRLRDVDYAAAITDLTRQQSTLEAAQKSFVRVAGLSLFDYL